MNPARLNKRLELQKRVSGKGGYGQRKESWVKVKSVWAELKPKSADESVKSSAEVSEITHEIKIRYRKGVTARMRFVGKGRTFDIVAAPINENERNRYLILRCVERFGA